MIVSTVSLKGGVGKSTVAINLAVYFNNSGFEVILVDADENGSCLKWSGIRDIDDKITCISLPTAPGLRNNVDDLHKKCDVLIIDGTPAINEIAATIMLASDVCLFPLQASPLDVWAFSDKFFPKFNEIRSLREQSGDRKLIGKILLNNIDSRTNLSAEIYDVIKEYDLEAFETVLSDLAVYKDSIAYGLSALEVKHKKAEREVNRLGNEVLTLIK